MSTDSPRTADTTTGSSGTAAGSGTAAERQAELDLAAMPEDKPAMPTFAEYIAQVSATVGQGTRRLYRSYWNRILDQWAERRLDEVTASDIRQLVEYTKTHTVARRNARGGRSAGEHLIAALRCLYRRAEEDRLISRDANPALRVKKPRRLPSTRRAVPDARLAEINHFAATTGNDPALDALLLPCTPRPRAAAAARSRCDRRTWTEVSASCSCVRRARPSAGSRSPPPS